MLVFPLFSLCIWASWHHVKHAFMFQRVNTYHTPIFPIMGIPHPSFTRPRGQAPELDLPDEVSSRGSKSSKLSSAAAHRKKGRRRRSVLDGNANNPVPTTPVLQKNRVSLISIHFGMFQENDGISSQVDFLRSVWRLISNVMKKTLEDQHLNIKFDV